MWFSIFFVMVNDPHILFLFQGSWWVRDLGIFLLCSLWQYGLWSFQTGDTKLDRFLPKNQHTQKKIIEFLNLGYCKIDVIKNVNNKKCDPKLIFFNEKVSINFWHRELTLKVKFWHFLTPPPFEISTTRSAITAHRAFLIDVMSFRSLGSFFLLC